jgi:hypothetical protein
MTEEGEWEFFTRFVLIRTSGSLDALRLPSGFGSVSGSSIGYRAAREEPSLSSLSGDIIASMISYCTEEM